MHFSSNSPKYPEHFKGQRCIQNPTLSSVIDICYTNTITVFDLYPKIFPEVKVATELVRLVQWLGAIFSVHIERIVIIFIAGVCSRLIKEKLNCLKSHEIRIGMSWDKKKRRHIAIALLQWLHCNRFVAVAYLQWFLLQRESVFFYQ